MARKRKAQEGSLPPEWLAALSDASLRDMAGAAVFARGQAYFSDDAVELVADDGISARFEARGSQRYQVDLHFEDPGLHADCTCPHAADGNFCKHMVAAALVWRRMLGGEETAAPNPPEPALTQARMAKAAQTRAANAQALRTFLAAQPAEQLAARLWQRAQQDRDLMAELKGWAAAADAAGDPKALRRAVDELLKISQRQYLETRELRAWAGRVEQAAQLLRDALPRHAAAVRAIAESAMQQAQGVQQRAHEDPGAVEEPIDLMMGVLVDALRAEPPPAAWAEHLLQRMQGDGGHPWRQPRVLEAAGPDVARRFSQRLAEHWARVAAAEPPAGDARPSSKTVERRWQRDAERSQLRRWMIDDLQRQGDPQAVFDFMRRTAADVHDHVQLIQWCEAHGRARDALQLAQAACRRFDNDRRLEDLLLAAYERDGWDDEALAIQRQRFTRMPAPDLYLPLVAAARRAKADLAALRAWAHETAAARELQELQRETEALRRYAFMQRPGTQAARNVSWRAGLHLLDGDIAAAFALVVQPPHVCDPRVLEALADALPAARKDDAFALLRRCFEFEMRRAQSPYAEALRLVAKAAGRLKAAPAQAWLRELAQTHRAKRNFVAGLPVYN